MATTGLPMLDPLGMWRDALSQWESRSNQMAQKEMGSEDFARTMNGLLGLSMGLQQALGKANGTLLKELNLPSRGEVLELGERLQRIEDQLALITRALGAQNPALAPSPSVMPPRTRRPSTGAAGSVATGPMAAEPAQGTPTPVVRRQATPKKKPAAPRKKAPAPTVARKTRTARGG